MALVFMPASASLWIRKSLRIALAAVHNEKRQIYVSYTTRPYYSALQNRMNTGWSHTEGFRTNVY